jgi:hypothetical protein
MNKIRYIQKINKMSNYYFIIPIENIPNNILRVLNFQSPPPSILSPDEEIKDELKEHELLTEEYTIDVNSNELSSDG